MTITDLNGKHICILGYGREGQAMVDALHEYAPECNITVCDQNTELKIDNEQLKIQLGTSWLENLDRFDVIIKSPGIPPNPLLDAVKEKTTSSTRIFLDTIVGRDAVIIGVTGSKGKSTTASLIAAILEAAHKDTVFAGNIGEPSIARLDDVKQGTFVVLEMSSYQLSDITVSPHFAVITSFFPDHLDYHGSLDAYLDAKKNIARFQQDGDMLFFNATSPGAIDIAKEGHGRKIPFTAEDAPLRIEETQLLGAHNLSNITAACMVAAACGVDKETALTVVKNFKGLPHRLQSLGIHHGMEWIDDAISTTPESTIAGLDALDNRVTTLILGGKDRGYDFGELGQRIKESSVSNIILFPGSGPRIKDAIVAAGALVECFEAQTMQEAVSIAKKVTGGRTPLGHPIILLSTASPSYGMFKNFEDKGDQFAAAINAL